MQPFSFQSLSVLVCLGLASSNALRLFARMASTKGSDIANSFTRANLTPSVVPKAPDNLFEVAYGPQSVSLGNELSTDDVAEAPTSYIFRQSKPDKLYTFILTDPDAPSIEDPKYGPWRHFVKVNVRPSEFNTSGDVITPYIGAKPPANSGFHRYVWLAYEQAEGEIHPPEVVEFADRRSWKLQEWLAEYKLGDPVAGNFFLARNATDRAQGVGGSSLKFALATAIATVALL